MKVSDGNFVAKVGKGGGIILRMKWADQREAEEIVEALKKETEGPKRRVRFLLMPVGHQCEANDSLSRSLLSEVALMDRDERCYNSSRPPSCISRLGQVVP